jgi:hypothetical protein
LTNPPNTPAKGFTLSYATASLLPRVQLAGKWFSRVGIFLLVAGTLAALIGLLANLQYAHSYPAPDIVLFLLGIAAAPILGVLITLSGIYLRQGSVAAARCALVLIGCVVLGCLGLLVGALLEGIESLRRHASIDAAITFAAGLLIIAGVLALVWLARFMVPLCRHNS